MAAVDVVAATWLSIPMRLIARAIAGMRTTDAPATYREAKELFVCFLPDTARSSRRTRKIFARLTLLPSEPVRHEVDPAGFRPRGPARP